MRKPSLVITITYPPKRAVQSPRPKRVERNSRSKRPTPNRISPAPSYFVPRRSRSDRLAPAPVVLPTTIPAPPPNTISLRPPELTRQQPLEARFTAIESRLSILIKQVDELKNLANKMPPAASNTCSAIPNVAAPMLIEQFCQRNGLSRSTYYSLMDLPSSAPEQRLALLICNCTIKNPCGRLSCYICNQRYWRKRRAIIEPLAAACADSEISWCTVIIRVSQLGHPILEDMISEFKGAFSKSLERFPLVQWSGRIEIDYFDHKVCSKGPQKERTYLALGWNPSDEMPSLIPHAHLVVAHPGVSRDTLSYHLKRVFPASRRVEMRPFDDKRDRAESLDNLVRYPLKPPLDQLFFAGCKSKNHVPRHPRVVRYMECVRECLNGPGQSSHLELDHLFQPQSDPRGSEPSSAQSQNIPIPESVPPFHPPLRAEVTVVPKYHRRGGFKLVAPKRSFAPEYKPTLRRICTPKCK